MRAQPGVILRIIICCTLLAFGEAELRAATTIWAATRAGVYKSIDGSTWQQAPVTTSNPLLQGSNLGGINIGPTSKLIRPRKCFRSFGCVGSARQRRQRHNSIVEESHEVI